MIAVDSLTMIQGNFILRDVSFQIPTGQYGVLMGSTGSGKSSILEAIAGLRPIVSGRIALGEVDMRSTPPDKRDIGFVPQEGALFRTMTVYNHLAFGLWLRKRPKAVIHARVQELASWLGIEHLLERRPQGLSGGESQRVALGRALSYKPRYLLLDEPLSALDETTRASMVELLDKLRRTREVTVLHVTHNSSEADKLGDVIFRIKQGKLRRLLMRITVEYFGPLRELTGLTRESADVASPCTVGELLAQLAEKHGERFAHFVLADGRPANTLLFALGDEQATADTLLHDGDEFIIIPPVSGG